LLGPRYRKPFPKIKIYHYTPGAHASQHRRKHIQAASVVYLVDTDVVEDERLVPVRVARLVRTDWTTGVQMLLIHYITRYTLVVSHDLYTVCVRVPRSPILRTQHRSRLSRLTYVHPCMPVIPLVPSDSPTLISSLLRLSAHHLALAASASQPLKSGTLRTCSPDTFRRHLKTHYCQQAFHST